MTFVRIRRRIRKTQGRQMIRFTPLPFQQHYYCSSHQKQQRIVGGSSGGGSSCLFIVVSVGFLLLCITSSFSVYAEGPHCNQVGHGPEDIIMASGRINPKYTWYKRGHKTYVPVVMDPLYSYKEHSTIVGGLKEIQGKTCVEFDFYDDEHSLNGKDYVFITRTTKRGCWSYIGRIGRGKQEIGLPPGCITHRTAMHEMMHALGFRREHVRGDRNFYVEILWQNIRPGRESNFQKRSNEASVGPYDYDSIMHYERKAFSVNSKETIRPLKNGVKIGVRQKMSYWDAKKINIMYGCNAGGGGGGGGHLSWSPENEDGEEIDHDALGSYLPRNSSSSPPSSGEIEVAYDELDYDPGNGGSGSSPRARSDRFHDADEHEFPTGEDDSSAENFGTDHRPSRYSRNRHSSRNDDSHNHFDSPGHPDHHSINSNNNNPNGFSHGANPIPQSYSHFSLDTSPGGSGSEGAPDAGHDENSSVADDEFLDFD